MPNNKETEGVIFNSEHKNKTFPKAFFFFLGTGLNEVTLN